MVDPSSQNIDRKARMEIGYQEPSLRPVQERLRDFKETILPLEPERAVREATRCLQCPKPPCVKACPAHNDIPAALRRIEQGDFLGAAAVFRRTSTMPQICGRVCPHEQLCQGACVRNKCGEPVLCGALEAFVTDYERAQKPFLIQPGTSTGRRVAVVGSGPAGLACAEQLVLRGHRVTVFEAAASPGGLLFYGIPSFKLAKSITQTLLDDLRHAGVEFRVNTPIGKDYPVDRLFAEGYHVVFLGIGSAVPARMNVSGEDLPGVYPPDEFLARINVDHQYLPKSWQKELAIGKRVAVVGGGDTASDCLRTALRLGAEKVTCLYRRTEAEMPGRKKDRALAREEGAAYQFLTQPIRFLAGPDGRVGAVESLQCKLGEPDEKGRCRPIPIECSNFIVEADTVILTLGYWPDPEIGQTTKGLETYKNGLIRADPQSGVTSRAGIFAGGDTVTGPDLVVTAMAAGRRAAQAMDSYLQEKIIHSQDDI